MRDRRGAKEAAANQVRGQRRNDDQENGPDCPATGYHLQRLSRRSYLVLGLLAVVASVVVVAWMVRGRRHQRLEPVIPTDGVSLPLAQNRAANISDLRYALSLTIPERKEEAIRGHETISFRLADASLPLLVDFAQSADHVSSLSSGSQTISISASHGHLVIPPTSLREGENQLTIDFIGGDAPLNRNDDFLYSLFVPARASQTFPCFDQPDLKGALTLTLEVPAGWEAVANGFERDRQTQSGRTVMHFAATQPLPTYLYGFAAGRFSIERSDREGRVFRLFHRETDPAKVARNRDAIFNLHESALKWLEDYTGRAYSFDKLDFVLIPSFQFAGMEHAGAIFYNASSLLLDETATQEQELARANVIAHETSHMWFGDLVTMKWFDDVWLKEVFANFMAAKIVNPSFPNINHDLKFLIEHYPPAYEIDRTPAPNPIRQQLDNLNEAGSLYGNIIYDKAPIVMRQLEEILGPDNLRDGLRDYLNRFAFRNATWTDLINMLDARTDENLAAWSHAWVDEPGRPTITTDVTRKADEMTGLAFSQSDPRKRQLIWNQHLQIALGYAGGVRITPLHLSSERAVMPINSSLPAPSYILPNGEGVGYGLFRLDAETKAFFLAHLPETGHSITRATAWITLWDDMLEGGTQPKQLIDLALRSLPAELEQQNVDLVLGYLDEAYWTFITDADRTALAPQVEAVLRAGIQNARERSLKASYFAAFRQMVLTDGGVAYLRRLWSKQDTIAGLPFAEPDFIAMAQALAIRGVAGAPQLLEEQLARIQNPDRRARFAFVMPALSPDEAVRDQFFAGLANVENRRHEPWVLDALAALNHPLRAAHAERYIKPSLDLLQSIQRTGDIFFPMRWTRAALSGHNSPAAAKVVTDFLSQQPNYPPRLMQIVEQASDTLMRASRIVPDSGRR